VSPVGDWIDTHWNPELALRDWWRLLAECDLPRRDLLAGLAERGLIGPPPGIAVDMGAPTIKQHGSPEQQARWLPEVYGGRQAWCQLFSEPGAGSDLASLSCRAVRDGDEFVITGQKVWTSRADEADRGMLLARTNTGVPKREGITWMLVDMHQPGVEVRPLVQINGSREFSEVFLTEARVPVADVVGGIDRGWDVARTTLRYERASTGQRVLPGLVQIRPGGRVGNLDRPVGELLQRAAARDPDKRVEVMIGARSMIRLATDRGRTTDPVVRDRLADYYVRSQVHRLLGRRSTQPNLRKLSLAMLAHRSRDLSLELLGAEATLDGGVQRTGLSSFVPSLGGGTNEIQRNVIGEQVLGLPREPEVPQ